jgi:tetratricopeptide (TPR) repeat protein
MCQLTALPASRFCDSFVRCRLKKEENPMKTANFKSQIAKAKILDFSFYLLPLAFLISACAAFQVGSQIQPGRYALLRGDSKAALAHFRRAAELDPDASIRVGPMKEGVWTYLGRAYYDSKDFAAARKALEQARSRHPDDAFAPLYLGLVLSRDGDRQTGVKELRAGLTGLKDWLEYINQYTIDAPYWDPGAIIRSRIEKDLAAIEGRDINWPELIASVERVGLDIESEPDEVRRQKRKERRDSAKGDDRGR